MERCDLCHAKEMHRVSSYMTPETIWMGCLTRLSQTSHLNTASKFLPFFPYMADFELVLTTRTVEEIQEPVFHLLSLGSNISHKTNTLPQKHFFLNLQSSKDLSGKVSTAY